MAQSMQDPFDDDIDLELRCLDESLEAPEAWEPYADLWWQHKKMEVQSRSKLARDMEEMKPSKR